MRNVFLTRKNLYVIHHTRSISVSSLPSPLTSTLKALNRHYIIHISLSPSCWILFWVTSTSYNSVHLSPLGGASAHDSSDQRCRAWRQMHADSFSLSLSWLHSGGGLSIWEGVNGTRPSVISECFQLQVNASARLLFLFFGLLLLLLLLWLWKSFILFFILLKNIKNTKTSTKYNTTFTILQLHKWKGAVWRLKFLFFVCPLVNQKISIYKYTFTCIGIS